MEKLEDCEKTRLFDGVLWAGKYWQSSDAEDHRQSLAFAQSRLQKIAADAQALASDIEELYAFTEERGWCIDVSGLWALIKCAATDYPVWHDVMKNHGAWHLFMDKAVTQSREGPHLSDVLAVFADEIGDQNVLQPFFDYEKSRKRTSDPVRALLEHLDTNLEYALPSGFKLTDQAIATLASILFDLDPLPTAASIKQLRYRMRANNR